MTAKLNLSALLTQNTTPAQIRAHTTRKRAPRTPNTTASHIAGEKHPFIPARNSAPPIPTLRCVGPDQQIPPTERKRVDRLQSDLAFSRATLHAEQARSRFFAQILSAI